MASGIIVLFEVPTKYGKLKQQKINIIFRDAPRKSVACYFIPCHMHRQLQKCERTGGRIWLFSVFFLKN